MPIAIIVHGGAKEIPPDKEAANRKGCYRAAEAGWAVLQKGGSAIDAVEEAIRLLEDDPTYNAGCGSELNADGEVQMDAAIMEGKDLRAGAVGFIQGVRHPISVARKVFEGEEVLLTGDGAYKFARDEHVELIPNEDLITLEKLEKWQEEQAVGSGAGKANNTVGAVAIDSQGLLAAGVSTGGTGGNKRGRLGDSPQIGCGIYADNDLGACAVTGDGEQIARIVFAKSAVDRLESCDPHCVAEQVLQKMEDRVGGEAGCILVDKTGRIGWNHHDSTEMAVGYRAEGMAEPLTFIRKREENGQG